MIRSELIQKIHDENPQISKADAERVVEAIFAEMIEALARGDRVEIRGFGAFSTRQRDSRMGRNPRTGDAVPVAAKRAVHFKCGKGLADRLNGREA